MKYVILTAMVLLFASCARETTKYVYTDSVASGDTPVHILPVEEPVVIPPKGCSVLELKHFKLKDTKNGDTLKIVKTEDVETVIYCPAVTQ